VVIRVIKDGDVGEVVATFDLHADVYPHGALPLGALVTLPRGVGDLAAGALAPGPPEKQPAVVVSSAGDGRVRPSRPLEIEDERALVLAHGPALRLGEHGRAGLVEQVVDRLPADDIALRVQDVDRRTAPVVTTGVVEVVAAVQPGESPVQAG